jgi:hypothetical protein
MGIKSVLLGSAVVSIVAAGVISCGGGSKTGPQSGGVAEAAGGNPFGGEVYELPCNVFDDNEWFAATGIATGPRTRMDVIQMSALTNAQNVIRRKMQHAYQGIVSDYSNYIGNNQGTDADVHIESAGDQIIDAVVKDSRAVCGPKFSAPDEKGQVNCFIAVKISKKEVSDKLADKVEDMVSKNEELRIRFDESNFRDRMDEKFKSFKEEQSN